MRTEGSLRRKIWKPFDWILLWLEKYWQTLIGRWRKESDRGRKRVTIEDVIKKSILPLAFMVFWFWMTKTIMKVSGQTDWFWWMLSNELYNHKDAELTKERNHAYELTLRYNQTKDDETELRTSILQQLAGKLGNNVVIKPPFQCDYGYNLILGDNVFMNYGCSILDCNVVEIGNNVLMAPNVQIYAAYHPTDHTLRLKDLEYADRVKIGDNTWIGGGSIILNGVTIGKNTVIGAGSVVTKDIPDNVVAVGNPCRVIKRLDKENVENGKRLKFTDFAHINIVVDDIDEGIKYYEQLLEAKPIQIFREFSNIGFAKAAGFLEHPELVKLSIAFMEIPGTKLTLELMEYYEPVTTDAKHREDVNKINGVRHVALEIQNIDEAFKYIKTCPDITLINPSEQYGPYKIDDITADEVQFFEADMEADANIKKQLCQTISNTYYFYFIDKYGVQWEFEQGHDY